ncbi:MAG TPA: prolyl oligopeptidase family serine peptidase [Phycisphaerae bacterium]|nr:prolyl oligopeptidase family serine peptidase [Phycisphaerae bacterium]
MLSRNRSWWLVVLIACAVIAGNVMVARTVRAADPPATKTVQVTERIHGVEVADPYRWLEDESDAEVRTWLAGQRTFAHGWLNRFEQRKVLTKRFEQLFAVTKTSPPTVYKNRYLFSRHEGLKNQSVYYVREGSHRAPERVLLDPNSWSDDGTVALDWMRPTPDASLIAYGKSASGSEKSTLYVLDVASGKHLPDEIPFTRYCVVAWDPDEKGFLYSRYPEPGAVPTGDENYYRRLYHHRLGDDWRKDPVVLGDLVQKEELIGVSATSDNRYVRMNRAVDWARNDLYFRPLGSDAKFQPIAVGLDGQVSADTYGDQLFIRTNVDAPRYRIARAPINQPGPSNWNDVIPQQKGVIDGFSIVGGRLIVEVSENVYSRLFVYELGGKLLDEIELPTLGTVGGVNGEPDGKELFFSFESFAYPPANFRYEIDTGKLERFEQTETGLDLDRYETRQVWFTSKDGTRVPMFVTHRKGMELDGDNPTVLSGYGGFDIALRPRFDFRKIPWLDAGGVFAVANLRGGGEFGKEWHLAGRLGKKQNVFDDFIAAAEKLIELKYTNPKRLAISGGSNGGLLVGACMTQRPELFQAVICAVPLLDMVRYHHFQIARLWIPEYGSAEDPEQFKWLYAYSPYHHVSKGTDYPATLLLTAESDSRVEPMHAYKMAAALQAATGGDRPILLRVEEKAGHGVGKPLAKQIEEQVDIWIFLMSQLELIDA